MYNFMKSAYFDITFAVLYSNMPHTYGCYDFVVVHLPRTMDIYNSRICQIGRHIGPFDSCLIYVTRSDLHIAVILYLATT